VRLVLCHSGLFVVRQDAAVGPAVEQSLHHAHAEAATVLQSPLSAHLSWRQYSGSIEHTCEATSNLHPLLCVSLIRCWTTRRRWQPSATMQLGSNAPC
jgi:hypothetical protein